MVNVKVLEFSMLIAIRILLLEAGIQRITVVPKLDPLNNIKFFNSYAYLMNDTFI